MSTCFAVVLNGNTEIKYFPFHDTRSADKAEAMADEWRYQALDAIGAEESDRFHLRVVRPKVVFQLLSGAVVECDLDDVDINPRACADLDYHLCAFGFNRGLGYSGNWDLDGAEIIEYIA